MVNVRFDRIEDYNCRYTVGDYRSMMENGVQPEDALNMLAPRSRDNARTPYQWDDTANAGFTTGTPWLKVNPRYTEINLEADRRSRGSIFGYYQKLIGLRKTCPAVVDGDLNFLLEEHPQIVMYLRACNEQTLLIMVNLSGETVDVQWPEQVTARSWKRILTNRDGAIPSVDGRKEWLPWEAEVYTLT